MGPLVLGTLTLVPLVLWAAGPMELWRGGVPERVTTVGVGLGLTAFAAYALNVILGARLFSVQRFFGGLSSLYRVHRIFGRAVYALVLLHVCFILIGRSWVQMTDALLLFTPSAGLEVWAGVVAFAVMTTGIYLTLYARLTHETFVWVQRGLGATFAIAAVHAFLTDRALSSATALKSYLIVLAVAAVMAFVYRSVLGDLLIRRFDYVVTEAKELDPSVVEIAMAPADRALKARPGQFVFVTFYSDRFDAQFHPISVSAAGSSAIIELRPGQARDQFHPFSLTSAPGDRELRLVVKAVGSFTRALHLLEPGAAARVEGPYGEFSYLNVDNPNQVWLAGGIGITPFLSMARSLGDEGHEIVLYHAVRTRAEAFFAEELEEIAARVPGFTVEIVPEDEAGFLTAGAIEREVDLGRCDFLIVGPPAMESALTEQLLQAGVPASKIHSERFAFGPRR